MRIACVIATNSSGGAERVMSIITKYFAESGNATFLINWDRDSNFYDIDKKVKVIKLGNEYPEFIAATNHFTKCTRGIKALKDCFLKIKPDVVIPFLIHSEILAIEACRQLNIPVVTSVRNGVSHYTWWQQQYRRIRYPQIAGVVFQSAKISQYKDFEHVRNKAVIMNPIDLNAVNVNRAVKRDYNKIVSVGRLTKQKNQILLLKAFCKIHDTYKNTHLHIFGDGEMREELKQVIDDLGLLNCVKLEGIVLNATALHNDAGMFVLSSDMEGFPNALTEAMANGIPSISSDFDTGVASELIVSGVNGYTFLVGNKEDLVQKMSRILSDNRLADKMGENARGIVNKLDYRVIGNEWVSFIEKCLEDEDRCRK